MPPRRRVVVEVIPLFGCVHVRRAPKATTSGSHVGRTLYMYAEERDDTGSSRSRRDYSRLKGTPSAAGGRIRPTSPATAAIVMM
jgi:hypothetical protein